MKDTQLSFETIGVGDLVNVEAGVADAFTHNFTGRVIKKSEPTKFDTNWIISVEDQDGDVWDVEPEQCSPCSDEYIH